MFSPETLPGNPSEAGPDNRQQAIAENDWHDLMTYSREETQFALVRYGARTREDRRQLREAIARATQLLADADKILKGIDEVTLWATNT